MVPSAQLCCHAGSSTPGVRDAENVIEQQRRNTAVHMAGRALVRQRQRDHSLHRPVSEPFQNERRRNGVLGAGHGVVTSHALTVPHVDQPLGHLG